MPAPPSLPPALLARPFTVAEALALGVTRDVLRGARLSSPFRGVRVSRALPASLELRCRSAALVLPADHRFSHVTAAWLRSVPVAGRWADEPLDVTTSRHGLRVRGIRFHLDSHSDSDSHHDLVPDRPVPDDRPADGGCCTSCCVRVGELHVAPAGQTWARLSGVLASDDLVIAGDHLLRHGWVSTRSLDEAVAAHRGRRGARALREALPLLEPRTDSPMETRLRLLLVRGGLPRPVAGRDVFVDGGWIARPDLSYPDLRIAIEYDGDHHRTDRRQWMADKFRRRLLEDAGWLVIELVADDVLRHGAATVSRVRTAIAARS